MKRLINHIRRWNMWRKYSLNSRYHKFLVLFGIIQSPTMLCVDFEKIENYPYGYKDYFVGHAPDISKNTKEKENDQT